VRRIVLDTNVLVSGLISATNPPGRIIDGIRADEIRICIDDRIFTEYRDVLTRPELARWIRRDDGIAILDHIGSSADRVDGFVTVNGLPDPDDAPFLEVALIAGVPLITGNVRHFPDERAGPAVVLTPRAFLTAGTE
jgi:putative PIN family toxin of toxin-antitoxin system